MKTSHGSHAAEEILLHMETFCVKCFSAYDHISAASEADVATPGAKYTVPWSSL